MSDARSDGRSPGDLRDVDIIPGFVRTASGSCLIEAGGTRVICTASVDEEVPRWMAGQGRGWATAEYGMLPASTGERKRRDVSKGRADGRTVEIQRLIGRSLRGVIDFRRSASAPSGSTATCSRPTAAPAARPSPAGTSRSSSPCAGS
jgi:ribonuclease PH